MALLLTATAEARVTNCNTINTSTTRAAYYINTAKAKGQITKGRGFNIVELAREKPNVATAAESSPNRGRNKTRRIPVA
ncbi:MAG: hypothetical protein QXS00_04925 [Pyrobaculum sp.]|uniref:hypothetical protein n=1 Tax=Pyrobaculum sp. TaxID=2004705 RepID=UPI0031608EA8